MKNRKKLINTAFGIVVVALFITGYLLSWNFAKKPLNESQFDLYEKIAQDIYEQRDQSIVEAPDGVLVEKTATSITVKSSFGYTGKVEAKLRNGELVFTRTSGTAESVCMSTILGAAFVFIFILCYAFVSTIHETITEKKNKSK